MKVTGVIAEYNPFHNGHKLHLKKARQETGADYIIVVMSGPFTQRGEPALGDKYLRAQMALKNGADLVLELPCFFACASAPYFARGAVTLLDRLGIVDTISFGSECGDTAPLMEIAALLEKEPPAFQEAFRHHTKSGLTFPQAREKALLESALLPRETTGLLASSNNILGVEYCRTLLSRKSAMLPHTIKRQGNGYTEEALQPAFSSALSIRKAMETADEAIPGFLASQMPDNVFDLLGSQWQKTLPVFPNALSFPLHYKLLSCAQKGFSHFFDVTEDLSVRIQNNLEAFTSFSGFCDCLKTKELTYSRISRSLLHILLDITQADVQEFQTHDLVFYARILGFQKASDGLFASLKKNASLPFVSKLADSYRQFQGPAKRQLSLDIHASQVYHSLVLHTLGHAFPSEFKRQIIRL